MSKTIAWGMSLVCVALLCSCAQERKPDPNDAATAEAADKVAGAAIKATDAAAKVSEAAGKTADAAAKVVEGAQAGLAEAVSKAGDALKSVQGGPELLTKVNELFTKGATTLQGITNVDSAKAALPELTELTNSTDEVSKALAGLPEGAKAAIGTVVEKGIGDLKAIVDKLMAIPGVEAVLKPAIEPWMAKLAALSGKSS